MPMPDFGKKVGPLPLGVWVGVGVVGLGIGYVINKRAAANAAAPTEQQLAESGVGTGGGSFLPINPPSTSTDTVEETNQSWGNKCITWLIAQNMNPVVANSAVNKFLTGQTLDGQESAMIAMALAHFGPPPDPVGAPPPPEPEPESPNPKTPTNLVVSIKTAKRICVTWTSVIGASKYEIAADSRFGTTGPVTTIIPSWQSGAEPGTAYTIYVWAVNDYGKSEPASIQITTPGGTSDNGGGNSTPNNPPPPPPPPPAKTYTIQKGDTLWGISSKMYGTGSRWINIYSANSGAIEAAARANGKSSSRGPNGTMGWWIFPGTVLTIP